MSTQTLPMKPIEMIAQGLQGLVHEAAETAARRVKEEIREEFGPRFDRMDARLDGMEVRLDRMDSRLDRMDSRLDRMDNRLDGMEARLDGMDTRLDRMDTRLERQDGTLRMVWKQVKGNGKLPIDDPLP